MFRKPIKIKSNTPVKGSERKNIKDKIHKYYPTLTEDDLNNLLPKKEGLNIVKIVTASSEIIQVYTVQKRPICFELYDKLFPTLYLLWQFPNIIHNFTTHKEVMNFINSGADLMLPGVLTPPVQSGLPKYGCAIQKDAIVAINLSTNRASIAVGYAAMSSADMEASGRRGKCVTIIHLYGDKLFTLEGQNGSVPNMGPPEWLNFNNDLDFPPLGATPIRKVDLSSSETCGMLQPDVEDIVLIENKNDGVVVNEDDNNLDIDDMKKEMSVEEVDELLYKTFFTAIKYSKTLTLPILTSNFYKLQMLANCPPGKTLDIKKSSFKKLKPFLDKMCKDNIITVKEMKKGVESIVEINKSHPKYEEFYVKPDERPRKNQDDSSSKSDTTNITESYIVTNNVLPILNSKEPKWQKGDTITGNDVKKHVREYILLNNCQHENSRLVQPDATLSAICKNTNPIAWEEVHEKVCGAMKNCFKVQTSQAEILNKGKVSPITMSVANRSGNKKVTLVDNLELFGVKVAEFAKECQHGVAASTSISIPPGKKTEQLLVQGNQILFIYNLLVDKYQIPKRYIRGLENAPKKKR